MRVIDGADDGVYERLLADCVREVAQSPQPTGSRRTIERSLGQDAVELQDRAGRGRAVIGTSVRMIARWLLRIVRSLVSRGLRPECSISLATLRVMATLRVIEAPAIRLDAIASSISESTRERRRVPGSVTISLRTIAPLARWSMT